MKYFFTILFLCALSAKAQQALQSGKYHITRNNSTTNVTPSSYRAGNIEIEQITVRAGTNEGEGNLLMVGVNDYFFWFNATPTAASITQIGTSGGWIIPIPASPTTNKAFFIPDKFSVVAYNGTKWGFDLKPEIFPIEIRLLVNGQPTGTLACIIRETGAIVWPSNTVYTAAAINGTGLTQYFIN